MADLSGLVSEDSQKLPERCSRSMLWRIADREGIDYPLDAIKSVMIDILDAHKVDYTKYFNWFAVTGKDLQGMPHQEIYPTIPEGNSDNKDIDYGGEMARRTDDEQEEESPDNTMVDALLKKNAELSERLDKLEIQKPALPLKSHLRWQLVHMAKARGIDYKDKTAEELRSALEE